MDGRNDSHTLFVDAFFFENGDLDTCGQDQRQLKLEQAAFDKYISLLHE